MGDYKTVLGVFDAISGISGRKEKEELLKSLSGSLEDAVKECCRLAYSSNITFQVKGYQGVKDCQHLGVLSLNDAIYTLEYVIGKRTVTGNPARTLIDDTFVMLSESDAEIFRRVVNKDMRCGMGGKTFNKVWNNLVYIHPYKRCSSFSVKNLAKINLPCFSQLKLDGLYCDIIVDVEKLIVTYVSRTGENLKLNVPSRDMELLKARPESYVFSGEVCVKDTDNGGYLPREVGNGYINGYDRDMSIVDFIIWDYIPYDKFLDGKFNLPYASAFNMVNNILSSVSDLNIMAVDSRIVNNLDEIVDHFRTVRLDGQEGLVIKNTNDTWKDGTSTGQVKLKTVAEVDLKVVGFEYGKVGTKYETCIGSISMESSDGLVKVNVAGLTDDERFNLLPKIPEMVASGQIAMVKCNDIISNDKEPDIFSLFLPRWGGLRDDKTVANTIDEIRNEINGFVDILSILEK